MIITQKQIHTLFQYLGSLFVNGFNMNPQFKYWLEQQTYVLTIQRGWGWRITQHQYCEYWNWNWHDIIEWDE